MQTRDAALTDPKALLVKFKAELDRWLLPEDAVREAARAIQKLEAEVENVHTQERLLNTPELRLHAQTALQGYRNAVQGYVAMEQPGLKLFLAILQTYTLPPALRKKIEIAARHYHKSTRVPRRSYGAAGYLRDIDIYERFEDTIGGHLAYAEKAVEVGKEHAETGAVTKLRVGSFTLINTGGFSEEVTETIAGLLKKAEALLRSSGFESVCYGNVPITNKVGRDGIAAFYVIQEDALFVRADAPSDHDTLRTILHELGHRYDFKNLPAQEVRRLYHLLEGQEDTHLQDRKLPAMGEEIITESKKKKTIFEVVGYRPAPGGGMYILLGLKGEPGVVGRTTLEAWHTFKPAQRDPDTTPNYKGFVTNYAKKDEHENFAEMFSFYCLGRLPVLQSVPFEELCFHGKVSLPHGRVDRLACRVALRWFFPPRSVDPG